MTYLNTKDLDNLTLVCKKANEYMKPFINHCAISGDSWFTLDERLYVLSEDGTPQYFLQALSDGVHKFYVKLNDSKNAADCYFIDDKYGGASQLSNTYLFEINICCIGESSIGEGFYAAKLIQQQFFMWSLENVEIIP